MGAIKFGQIKFIYITALISLNLNSVFNWNVLRDMAMINL